MTTGRINQVAIRLGVPAAGHAGPAGNSAHPLSDGPSSLARRTPSKVFGQAAGATKGGASAASFANGRRQVWSSGSDHDSLTARKPMLQRPFSHSPRWGRIARWSIAHKSKRMTSEQAARTKRPARWPEGVRARREHPPPKPPACDWSASMPARERIHTSVRFGHQWPATAHGFLSASLGPAEDSARFERRQSTWVSIGKTDLH